MLISLLTGGFDIPYAFGMAKALASKGLQVDVIGSDDMWRPDLSDPPRLRLLSLRGDQRAGAPYWKKVARELMYYARLARYLLGARPKIVHVLWNNKFPLFDRTALMLLYKVSGASIALTAHNVNAGTRDGNDSLYNRATLRLQYHLADQVFVHTEKMKKELIREFSVPNSAVTVVPFGINNFSPDTAMTARDARQRLGVRPGEKTLLFFGNIQPYKGLEYLVAAFRSLLSTHQGFRLIIAGEPAKGSDDYISGIRSAIADASLRDHIIAHFNYVPDEDTEVYFKAADVVVLPYTHVYQSGVLFLAYRFGVPVVATDVGSFRDDIADGKTGFVCKPADAGDLAGSIDRYFKSELFEFLGSRRREISESASASNSWDVVGEITRQTYVQMLHRARGTKSGPAQSDGELRMRN